MEIVMHRVGVCLSLLHFSVPSFSDVNATMPLYTFKVTQRRFNAPDSFLTLVLFQIAYLLTGAAPVDASGQSKLRRFCPI